MLTGLAPVADARFDNHCRFHRVGKRRLPTTQRRSSAAGSWRVCIESGIRQSDSRCTAPARTPPSSTRMASALASSSATIRRFPTSMSTWCLAALLCSSCRRTTRCLSPSHRQRLPSFDTIEDAAAVITELSDSDSGHAPRRITGETTEQRTPSDTTADAHKSLQELCRNCITRARKPRRTNTELHREAMDGRNPLLSVCVAARRCRWGHVHRKHSPSVLLPRLHGAGIVRTDGARRRSALRAPRETLGWHPQSARLETVDCLHIQS